MTDKPFAKKDYRLTEDRDYYYLLAKQIPTVEFKKFHKLSKDAFIVTDNGNGHFVIERRTTPRIKGIEDWGAT